MVAGGAVKGISSVWYTIIYLFLLLHYNWLHVLITFGRAEMGTEITTIIKKVITNISLWQRTWGSAEISRNKEAIITQIANCRFKKEFIYSLTITAMLILDFSSHFYQVS